MVRAGPFPFGGFVCAQEERVRCVCGGAGRGTGEGEEGGVMMVDCDRCHRWFHGHCVGIPSQEVWTPPPPDRLDDLRNGFYSGST